MKRILVDIDDTIEELLEAWIKYLNNKYGFSVRPEDCRDWDMGILYPTLNGEQICSCLEEHDFWKTVKPKPYAAFYLQKLKKEGFDVILVTSTSHFNLKPKLESMLNVHFPFIPRQDIVVTTRKQLIKGDIMIDDYINNLVNGEYKKILVNCYHNRDVSTVGTDIIRATTWHEIYTLIHLMLDKED